MMVALIPEKHIMFILQADLINDWNLIAAWKQIEIYLRHGSELWK